MKTRQVNRIKGLERNVRIDVKYQPDLTCKRIIRISRFNIAASGLAASEMTFAWHDGGSQLRSRWLAGQNLWLSSTQANICPAGRTDGRTDQKRHRHCWKRPKRRHSRAGEGGGGGGGVTEARLAMTDGPSDRKSRLREIIFTVEPWHC